MGSNNNKQTPIKQLFENTRQYSLLLFLGLLTIVFYSVNRQFLTYLLGQIVDSAIDRNQIFNTGHILLFGLLIILSATLGGLRHFLANTYCNRSLYHLRKRTIESAGNYSLNDLSRLSSGSYISKMNDSLKEVEKFLKDTIFNTAFFLVTGLGAIVLGFYINIHMTLILVAVAAILTIFAEAMARSIKRKQKELLKVSTAIGGISQDSINGHIEVKSFDLYSILQNKLTGLLKNSTGISIAILKRESISESTLLSVSFSMQVLIVIIGLYFANRGSITLGDIVIFQQILHSMRRLWRIDFFSFSKTSSSMNHLFDLWTRTDEEHTGTVKAGVDRENVISLKDIRFKYDGNEREAVLDQLSLTLKRGETVAIVGGSGCGKSTLLKLIAGFHTPESGELFHEGVSYSEWDVRELRKKISIVEQSPYLFPASIAENIECGLIGYLPKHKFESRIREAAAHADIDSFISGLADGYDTIAGERGATLSGGQKQRIAIARAFLKEPEILLLDEPSSALDAESESKIDSILETLMNEKTTVIVSHRFSTIKRADRILVLDQKTIAEEGNHHELMRKQGIYYQLYNNQILDTRMFTNETE